MVKFSAVFALGVLSLTCAGQLQAHREREQRSEEVLPTPTATYTTTQWQEGAPRGRRFIPEETDTAERTTWDRDILSLHRRSLADPQGIIGIMVQMMNMVKVLADDFKQHKAVMSEAFQKVESGQKRSNKKLSELESNVRLSREELGQRFDGVEARLADAQETFAGISVGTSNLIEASLTKRLQSTEDGLKEVVGLLQENIYLVNRTALATGKGLHSIEEAILDKTEWLKGALVSDIALLINSTEQTMTELGIAVKEDQSLTQNLAVNMLDLKMDTTKTRSLVEKELELFNKSSALMERSLRKIEQAIPERSEELKEYIAKEMPAFCNATHEVVLDAVRDADSSITKTFAGMSVEMSNSIETSIAKHLQSTEDGLKETLGLLQENIHLVNRTALATGKGLRSIEQVILDKTEWLKRALASDIALLINSTEQTMTELSIAVKEDQSLTQDLAVNMLDIKMETTRTRNLVEKELQLFNGSSVSMERSLREIEQAIPEKTEELKQYIAKETIAFCNATHEVVLNAVRGIDSSITKILAGMCVEMSNSIEASVAKHLQGAEDGLKETLGLLQENIHLVNSTALANGRGLRNIEEAILDKTEWLKRVSVNILDIKMDTTRTWSLVERGQQLFNKSSALMERSLRKTEQAIPERSEELKEYIAKEMAVFRNATHEVVLDAVRDVDSSITKTFAGMSVEMSNSIETSVAKRLQSTQDGLKATLDLLQENIHLVDRTASATGRSLRGIEEAILDKTEWLKSALAGDIALLTNSTIQTMTELSIAVEEDKNLTKNLAVNILNLKTDTTRTRNLVEKELQLFNKSSVSLERSLRKIEEAIPESSEELKRDMAEGLTEFCNATHEVVLNAVRGVESSFAKLSTQMETERNATDTLLKKWNENQSEMILLEIRAMTQRVERLKEAWTWIMTKPFTANGCKTQINVHVQRAYIGLYVRMGDDNRSGQSGNCLKRYKNRRISYVIRHRSDSTNDIHGVTKTGRTYSNLYVAFRANGASINFKDYIDDDRLTIWVTIPPGKVPIGEQTDDNAFTTSLRIG